MIRAASAIAVLAAGLAFAAPAAAAPDGANLFKMQCRTCHGEMSSAMGPSLRGTAGSDIARRDDFKYSKALKEKDGAWTDANLDAFLTKPSAFAPGTRMMISVPNPENRAAILAYLKTLK